MKTLEPQRRITLSWYAVPGIAHPISPDQIEKMLCDFFATDQKTVFSKSRKRHLFLIRSYAYYLIYKYCKLSKSEISRRYGLDHTTIMNAISKLQDEYDYNDEIKSVLKTLENLTRRLRFE